MFFKNEIFWAFDLVQLGLLPDGWDIQLTDLVNQFGICTLLDHDSPTSREPSGGQPLEVCVVTGNVVFEHSHWLHALYSEQLAQFAAQFAGRSVVTAKDLKSAVNINLLRGHNSRYERHVDANPVTGILFVSTFTPSDGGALVFERDPCDTVIFPRAGIFIVFDAREITHYVSPLTVARDRISVPMNYYFAGASQDRPGDLNQYLYGNVL